MDIQLKKGVLELVILDFISEEDRYGYELNKLINETLQLSESAVYAVLKKMIESKICEQYLKESENGPPRKYYRITKLGKAQLQILTEEWMEFNEKILTLINRREEK